jgi:hypothetical protein
MIQFNCRVCGIYLEESPWGEDGNSPNYEMCSCCGVEFGNQDYTVESVKRYREKWLSDGAKWSLPKFKPSDWDLNEQMKNIPKEYL